MAGAELIDVHQDEILTGEAVALDTQPVGFLLRAAGAAIDVVATVTVAIVVALTASWLFGMRLLADNVNGIVTIVAIVLLVIVLPTTVETLSRGRSLGRLVVGARIVRDDGGASGLRQAFIRATVGVLEIWMTFGAVALFVGIFAPRSQRLGDLLAGTYSERTRSPRLRPTALPLPAQLSEWATVVDVTRLPDRLARRAAQFAEHAAGLESAQRSRLAADLAREISPQVSPLPDVDPETFLIGVLAVRREREFRALAARTRRADALSQSVSDSPRGFPER